MKKTSLIILTAAFAIILNSTAQAAEWLNFNTKTKSVHYQPSNLPKTSCVKSESVTAKNITLKTVMPGCYKSINVLPDGNTYDVVTAPGESAMPVGHPDIPAFAQWILVPNDAKIKLEINKGKTVVYKNFDIQPVQPEPPESVDDYVPEFTINRNIYNKNANYPGILAKFETVRKIRGQDATMVWLFPYQYNPVTKVLAVYPDLKVTVHFEGEGTSVEHRLRTKTFENFYKRIAPNADKILSLPSENKNKINSSFNENSLPAGCDLMIICAPEFTNSARIISNWKTKRGFLTEVVTTEETGTNYNDRNPELHQKRL